MPYGHPFNKTCRWQPAYIKLQSYELIHLVHCLSGKYEVYMLSVHPNLTLSYFLSNGEFLSLQLYKLISKLINV